MEAVVRLTRWSRRAFGRLKSRIRHKLAYPRIVFYSLVYNEFADIYYVGDTFMEPLFWIVDHFAKAMGPIFVTTITIVACTIITIAYTIGIPYWWQRNTWILAIALVIGHWLLVNIVFHYWMALTTNPGTPPEASHGASWAIHLPDASLFPSGLPSARGGVHMQEMHSAKTTSHAPLQHLQSLCPQDGSSLPYPFLPSNNSRLDHSSSVLK